MRTRTFSLLAPLLLAACGTAPSSPAEVGADNGGALPLGPDGRPFTITEVTSFSTPWAMAFLPGEGGALTNRALVTEKEGRLWLVDVATGRRQQVGGVPAVKVEGQGGLGDVVVHRDPAGNSRIYLSYVEAGPNGTSGAAVGYGRLVASAAAAPGAPAGYSLQDFRVVWRQTPKVDGAGHFAHRIAFAPDGTMFITSGERQKMQPAQDPASDLGKIIRLSADGQPVAAGPWASAGGRRATHWTMGHRNPLGLAFAPDGRLWSTEMGPEGGDELNLIEPGRNYGWPLASYGSHYGGEDIPDPHASRNFVEPKAWWNPSISPGGLLIYSGALFPGWTGDALIPALSGEALIRVDITGDRARKADQWPMGQRIRAVDEGPRGEIYLLEDAGRLVRLEPAAG